MKTIKNFQVSFTLIDQPSRGNYFYPPKEIERKLREFISEELLLDCESLAVEPLSCDSFARTSNADAIADDVKRNYRGEALKIAAGESRYLPEAEHVRVLAVMNVVLLDACRQVVIHGSHAAMSKLKDAIAFTEGRQ